MYEYSGRRAEHEEFDDPDEIFDETGNPEATDKDSQEDNQSDPTPLEDRLTVPNHIGECAEANEDKPELKREIPAKRPTFYRNILSSEHGIVLNGYSENGSTVSRRKPNLSYELPEQISRNPLYKGLLDSVDTNLSQAVQRRRDEFRAPGEIPPGPNDIHRLKVAQNTATRYFQSLGVDVSDRMPPLERYHFTAGLQQATNNGVASSGNQTFYGMTIAHCNNRILGAARADFTQVAASLHETMHFLAQHTVRVGLGGNKSTINQSYLTLLDNSQRGYTDGLLEAATEISVIKALGVEHAPIYGMFSGYSSQLAVFHDVITQMAEQTGEDPKKIMDQIALDYHFGDTTLVEKIGEALGLQRTAAVLRLDGHNTQRQVLTTAQNCGFRQAAEMIGRSNFSRLFKW